LSTPDRPLRADARRNRERVLAAAREAFAESGFGVPLDAIAARAGVGPGTVYRHFPTKEALFEAVTVARVRELVALARAGAEAPDPGAALDALLGRIAAEAVAKRDLPDALGGVGEAAVAVARGELHAAMDVLLDRARAVGAVRAGIGATELIALLKGLLQAVRESADPELPARLLAVVRDGLRPPPGWRGRWAPQATQ
jgi:AcrR family transcriptional regulator